MRALLGTWPRGLGLNISSFVNITFLYLVSNFRVEKLEHTLAVEDEDKGDEDEEDGHDDDDEQDLLQVIEVLQQRCEAVPCPHLGLLYLSNNE